MENKILENTNEIIKVKNDKEKKKKKNNNIKKNII